jgi:suppressor for copper-sensitivity B
MMVNHITLRALAKVFVLLLWLCPLQAQAAGDWQETPQVRVRLISGVSGTGTLATLPLGLEVVLAEGWKTYWRMPGDAGAPPQFEWPAASNPNLAQTALAFPLPERHVMFGMETIGYGGGVIFPLTLTPKQSGLAMPLLAKLTLLTCAELCIPHDFTLSLTIPAGEAAPTPEAPLLAAAMARVPQANKLMLHAATQDAQGTVMLEFTAPRPLAAPTAFIETAAGGLFAPPQITLRADQQSGTIQLAALNKTSQAQPLALMVTLGDGAQGWDSAVTVPPATMPPATMPPATMPHDPVTPAAAIVTIPLAAPVPVIAPVPAPPFWLMLCFAVLGGLILNLMPCVLPVLSLKLLKFMGHGGREHAVARRSFLLAAAGIVSSFMVLALMLLALRASGQSIGWGMQFQHPAFLGLMIVALLVFAANLWGWFELQLPDAFMQRLLHAGKHRKHLGDFLSGAFAALLATPCTAPFLGTAIGFALGGSAVTVLVMFAGMGGGMALPYLLVAAFPALATRMPRPGAWMLKLKRVLAFALVATALWLGSVLWLQTQPTARDARWQAFDASRIAPQIAAGKLVFVDVTAAWCLTCQTNKKLVLNREPVRSLLAQANLLAMQADWTKPDPVISTYLQSFQRAGIPFNVVYGPAAPQGIVLPELLTAQAVQAALEHALHSE